MKKILIYGVGSLSNRGCEALVNSTISQIDRDTKISLATFDYNNDKDKVNSAVSKVVNHYINKETDLDITNQYINEWLTIGLNITSNTATVYLGTRQGIYECILNNLSLTINDIEEIVFDSNNCSLYCRK